MDEDYLNRIAGGIQASKGIFDAARGAGRRVEPCPAFPICRLVGNARIGCDIGGMPASIDACIAGLILLTARGQGLYTERTEEELQERKERQIGFAVPPSNEADR